MKVIRLLDSSGDRVLDSVSAEYEDSFCLESFGDLIAAHANCEPKGTKSFIIARVQTWDHKQPDSKFFSYYHAYHLNKILFQTQVYFDKKLIHRLNVLNPLSNTDIIGHVEYFMVRPSRTEQTTAQKISKRISMLPENKPASTRASTNAIPPTSNRLSSTAKPGKKPDISIKINTNNMLKVPEVDLPPPSPTVRQIEQGGPTSWTIGSPRAALADEEDDLPANPNNTPATALVPPSFFNGIAKRLSGIPGTKSGPPSPSKKASIAPPTDLETGKNASQTIQALISHPNSTPKCPQPHESKSPKAPSPDSPNQSVHKKYHRPKNAADARYPSFEEWVLMVKSENSRREAAGEELLDYDEVNPFASPERGMPSMISEEEEEVEESKEDEITTYDAILFATDDDFLESSRIRAVFRDNAVLPEEAKLFEMTPVTSEPPASPEHGHFDDDEISACEWCFPSQTELAKYSPFSRFFHKYKCYMILIVFIVMLALFIVYTLRLTADQTDSTSVAKQSQYVYPTFPNVGVTTQTKASAFQSLKVVTTVATKSVQPI
ncbi:hypothetical protein BCR33DRAFT_764075 [Rhizoclosmatium globosum]|uniref:Uncharacterized protein n=1 Tax=Rhizoclosmatium globosum TaxID=329046 RepID=A0A1Y2CL32_9FUNG|nr:hypothetical protein BCR33DRAFT_764075 [Rhizoclosmatium globosum]|eukprot:ORY47667.1 hypothetical protein BCR33DRAFT_764075 [Rhizoclosmatium globosum]